MNETERDVVDRPVFLEPVEKPVEKTPRRKRETKSLLVFFSFIAALALLVGLNMR